jgi:hypothetical protein
MIYLKKSNVQEIDKHIKDAFKSKIIEGKLFALLKLVETKGEPMQAEDNEYLNGLKVLEYKKDFYIGFKKQEFLNGSFKLNTVALKTT